MKYLTPKETSTLRQVFKKDMTNKEGIKINIDFTSKTNNERQKDLNNYKRQLATYMKEDSSEVDLERLASQVQKLFKEVTQSDSRSRKPKT